MVTLIARNRSAEKKEKRKQWGTSKKILNYVYEDIGAYIFIPVYIDGVPILTTKYI